MFYSTNIGGNVHAAASAIRSMPPTVQRCVFQFVALTGSGSIVIFKATTPEDQEFIRSYFQLTGK